MTPEELHLRRVRAFCELASQELQAARMLAPSLPGQAAYFLQQCVEKLARGLLEMNRVQVGPMHDIGRLASLLPADDVFAEDLKGMDVLSPAATRFRYPGGAGDVRTIQEPELRTLLKAVEGLHAKIAPALTSYVQNNGRR